jgi:HIV Tat-specific factor 1
MQDTIIQTPAAPVLARANKKRKEPEDYTSATAVQSAGPSLKRSKNDKKSSKLPTERKPKNTAVYITNLPPDTDSEELHARFSKFGLIEEDEDGEAKIKMYAMDDGSFSGEALVVYFKEESVPLAINLLDDAELRIGDRESVMRVQMAEFGHKNVGEEGKGTGVKPRKTVDKKKTTKRIGRMQK